MVYLYLMIAIIAEVSATLALKPAEGFTKLAPSIVVVVGYAVSFYLLSIILKTLPVGITYAIWSGVGIVLTAVIAIFFVQANPRSPCNYWHELYYFGGGNYSSIFKYANRLIPS